MSAGTGAPVKGRQIRVMLDAMAHRGPDGAGEYCRDGVALGLRLTSSIRRRLEPSRWSAARTCSSTTARSTTPQELAAELRALGEPIETGTDTEVILAAYRQWGVDAIRLFNGMFAFALWNSERRRLLLARDMMGVKPLYLRRTARSLVFASELPAFLAGRPS